jgi:hypothetical protein
MDSSLSNTKPFTILPPHSFALSMAIVWILE